MAYRIVIEKKTVKFLASVPKRDYLKLQEHINEIAEDPYLSGSIKLQGSKNIYRYPLWQLPYFIYCRKIPTYCLYN